MAWVAAVITMLLAWSFILGWYVVIFGLFGIFVIPYRLVRRSSRKTQHVQRTALATQQAMYQQQAMMMQQLAATQSGQHQQPPAAYPLPEPPSPSLSPPPPPS